MMTRNRLVIVLLLALFAAAGTPIVAQVKIDERRPAKPRSEVQVENAFGSLEIVGWDKQEVVVTGTLAAGAEGLDFESEEKDVYVGVEAPDAWFYEGDDDTEFRSDLVVRVPRGSSVKVETTNATILVRDVEGAVSIETINGAVEVRGNPRSVEIETMTGGVDVQAMGAEMAVESVSGSVRLGGVRSGVGVTTISGDIDVQGEALREVDIETTAGNVRLDGTYTEAGEVDIETFDGVVELIVSPDVEARFELTSFSGEIRSELGPTPRKHGRFTPYRELSFSTGTNELEISVETYSGDIVLTRRGG